METAAVSTQAPQPVLPRMLAAAAAFLVASILLVVPFAILEEGLFEEDFQRGQSEGWWRGTASGGYLVLWLLQKVVYAVGAAALYVPMRQLKQPRSPSWPLVGWAVGVLCLLEFGVLLGLSSVLTVPAWVWVWWAFFGLLNAFVCVTAMDRVLAAMAEKAQHG